MNVACTWTRARLPALIDGRPMWGRTARHLGSCLRCQAEAARYRSLQRELADLRHVSVDAPGSLLPSVLGALDTPARPRRRRVAERTVATGAAVAIAGAVAVIGWRRLRAA